MFVPATCNESATRGRQKELGQFLTPAPIADFMASMFAPFPPVLRLLDAGAGAGELTRAVVSRLCRGAEDVRAIEATLYEIDPQIQSSLSETMEDCRRVSTRAGISFDFVIHPTDFIQEASAQLANNLFNPTPCVFDAAIVNPPYRKIATDSSERRNLSTVGVQTVNLYAGFIALIQRMLTSGGQLVGITPRSFCNGPYFRSFREDFLSNMAIQRLHIFESREAAFRSDTVLQENIIFYAIKGQKQPLELVISSSSGEHEIEISENTVPFKDVVHENDGEQFIHIPSASVHSSAKRTLEGFQSSLNKLGVNVSTGRVVDFRLKHALCSEAVEGSVPLLYPHNFNGGTVHWPMPHARKPKAILDNEATRPWLVKSGVYLLTKRFTSKEERRRLVACLFDPKEIKSEWLGFENHLNYFHAGGHGLDRDLAFGLFVFLNSTVVDQYFRRFSGHTQVNATDLRNLAYPDRRTLQEIGREIEEPSLSQKEIDKLLEKHLHVRSQIQ